MDEGEAGREMRMAVEEEAEEDVRVRRGGCSSRGYCLARGLALPPFAHSCPLIAAASPSPRRAIHLIIFLLFPGDASGQCPSSNPCAEPPATCILLPWHVAHRVCPLSVYHTVRYAPLTADGAPALPPPRTRARLFAQHFSKMVDAPSDDARYETVQEPAATMPLGGEEVRGNAHPPH